MKQLPILIAALLAGCAELPGFRPAPPPLATAAAPTAFRLDGRVSVRAGEESFSGGMTWHHAKQGQELLLSTPLGQGVAQLRGDAQGVELSDSEGRIHKAADAETLVQQTLGWTLPLKGLASWVVGTPRPDAPHAAEADAAGRLAVLNQDGWRIEFSRYAPVGAYVLPGKLIARRDGDLEIRLVVDQWALQ